MNVTTCTSCGRETVSSRDLAKDPTLRGQYVQRCTADTCTTCYRRQGREPKQHPPIAELVENVEWLIGTDNPENIATRVGYPNPQTLARRLNRHGRHDLARIFDDRHDRKKVPA